jgi:hypothetical protein
MNNQQLLLQGMRIYRRGPNLLTFSRPSDKLKTLVKSLMEISTEIFEEKQRGVPFRELKFDFAAFGCPKKTQLSPSEWIKVHADAVAVCIRIQEEVRRLPQDESDMTYAEL